MKRTCLAALLSLLAIAPVAGCFATDGRPEPVAAAPMPHEPGSLLDRDWMFVWIEDFSGDPGALIPLPGMILTRQAARVTGETSCNRFTAGYRVDEGSGRLRLTNLRNTRRLCQRANSEADDAIVRALLATDGYFLEDDRLELLSKGRVVARLRSKASVANMR